MTTDLRLIDFLDLEPVGATLADLDTPVPVIDIDRVQRNVERWQARCDAFGIANRPHIKTHKLAGLARYQLAAGAAGITVQKLGEAEVMADAGIVDMLIAFNVVGAPKLRRLAALIRRTDIVVVADSAAVAAGLAEAAGAAGRDLRVLVECDTGAGRNGVQTPAAAAALARDIDRTPGLVYGGLMTYPAPGTRAAAASFLAEAKARAADSGLATETVSTGGSPEMWRDEGLDVATEYRAGTNVYFDRSLVARDTCGWEDCAFTVLAMVVSRPTPERAIVDAGSKALTMDLLGLEDYGAIPALDGARIYELNEEHGYVDVSACAAPPAVGDMVRIVPNHVCPVSNLYDRVVFVRGEAVLGSAAVSARGMVR